MADGGVYLTEAALRKLNKGKRRPLNPLKWKDTDNKRKKDKGLEYKILKGKRAGRTVPALEPPTGVKTCRCKKEGCMLDAESYVLLFTEFRATSYDQQTQIIASCIRLDAPAQRAVPKENSVKFKRYTCRYSFKLRGKDYSTCRQRLCDTFKIRPSRLRRLVAKMEEGKLTFEDGRGKSCGVHALLLSDEFKDKIRTHIKSFPTFESHYCRGDADDERRYLDEELSVTKMVSLFNENQAVNGDRLCKFDAYNEIFKTEFDLRFGLPRKDTCNFCDAHKAMISRTTNPTELDAMQQALQLHQEVAQAARSMHKQDGIDCSDPNIFSITADMQKVLFVPRLSCSSAYFKRKLSTFNLGIHKTGSEDADMYIWDETIGEHTSKDIISCLYKYILRSFNRVPPGGCRTLILWSDRFVGQFNNCYMILFMKYLVDKKFFTKVEHKFFATGHSWMSCDRDFGLIEKRYKKMNPLIPNDILDVIASARVEKPFNITKMERADFLNFNILPEYVSLPSNLQVTRYHWFKYEACSPNVVFAKTSHMSLEWQSFKLLLKKTTGFQLIRKFPLAYKNQLQIHEAKAKDLRDLMEKIPDAEKFAYYDNITKFILV